MQAGDATLGGHAGDGMNVVLGPNDVLPEQAFGFDADAFDALVQQVQRSDVGSSDNSGNRGQAQTRYLMYHGLANAAGAEQVAADSFEFSDFITDFY